VTRQIGHYSSAVEMVANARYRQSMLQFCRFEELVLIRWRYECLYGVL